MNETLELSLQLFEGILALGFVALLGFYAEKRRFLGECARDSLSRLMLQVAFPCLAFHSMVTKVDPSHLNENAAAILLGVGFLFFGCLFGYLVVRATRLEGPRRRTFVHMLTTNNYIFLPLPIILLLNPDQEGTLFLITLGCATSFWVIGLFPLVWGTGEPLLRQLRHLLNPNILAMVSGLSISLLGLDWIFEKPGLNGLLHGLEIMGSATVPLALVFVGASLAASRAAEPPGLLLYYAFCRLLAFPLLMVPVIVWSGLPAEVAWVPLLISTMPASNTSTMLADRFGGSVSFASAANLYSIPLALVTVPVMFPLVRALHGLLAG